MATHDSSPADLPAGYKPQPFSDRQLYQLSLPAFTGPLDLLLFLCRRHRLELSDIPIAEITTRYLEYIDLMQELDVELATEFLVMASELLELKARMLLPREESAAEQEEELDPREDLARRLREYEKFKQVAQELDQLPRDGRDTFSPGVSQLPRESTQAQALYEFIDPFQLIAALADVLRTSDAHPVEVLDIQRLTLRQRVEELLERLADGLTRTFSDLFVMRGSRMEIILTFLAILELAKLRLLALHQADTDGAIFVVPRYQDYDQALELVNRAGSLPADEGETESDQDFSKETSNEQLD